MSAPFVLEGNLGKRIVSVCKTFLDVLGGGGITLGNLLALVGLLFLVQLLKALQVAHTSKVKDLECSSQVVILFLFFVAIGTLETMLASPRHEQMFVSTHLILVRFVKVLIAGKLEQWLLSIDIALGRLFLVLGSAILLCLCSLGLLGL